MKKFAEYLGIFCICFTQNVFAWGPSKEILQKDLFKYCMPSSIANNMSSADLKKYLPTYNTKKTTYNKENANEIVSICACSENYLYYPNTPENLATRLCQECEVGKVINPSNINECEEILCPAGTYGIEVPSDNGCPAGTYALSVPSENDCPAGTYSFSFIK